MSGAAIEASVPMFWRDEALPFIEARSVRDGRQVCYGKHWHETFSIGLISRGRCKYVNRNKTTEASLGTVVLMNPGDVPRLMEVAEFIRENCTRSLSLEEICAEACLSRSHLIRSFKEAYGLTPHAYQLNCRIEFCRLQLRAGHSLADIALAAGFSDQAHFQRIFKRFVAATPAQYQNPLS